MCGFLGYVREDRFRSSTDGLLKVLQKINHRGPDGQGYYDDSRVFLGHKRLSIIDLSAQASQPLRSKSHNAVIVFNGEIYNYKDLANSLDITTNSDTEVLLHGFLVKGVSFLKEIRGIYSFAIYKIDDQRLYLYRDLAGVKPLYYSHDSKNKRFIFSSEIKAVLPLLEEVSINESVLKQYIHLGYCLEPNTIYNEIKALDPGCLIDYDVNGNKYDKQLINYYDWSVKLKVRKTDFVAETNTLLRKACGRNLVSDVDLRLALSGGIDSSLLLGYFSELKSINSLTVKFSESTYDEASVAEIYSKHFKSNHRTISVENIGNLKVLNELLLHFDQPYADSSLIPFYLLNKEASNYTKVLIGGDGGDEIHNGYSGYRFLPLLLSLSKTKFVSLLFSLFTVFKSVLSFRRQRELMKLLSVTRFESELDAILNWNSWFPVSKYSYSKYPFKYEVDRVFDDLKLNFNLTNTEQLIEMVFFKTQLQSDFLKKADMMSMINGVEYRVPMLDEDLSSFSISIPYNCKSTIFKQKKILKNIHRIMYSGNYFDNKKKGFSIPLDTWLGEENIAFIEMYLSHQEGIVMKYINQEYIEVIFKTIRNENHELVKYCSRASAYQRMLILYSLQLWYFESFKRHSFSLV